MFLSRDPRRALIMHFTHVKNLPGILARGLLLPDTSVGAHLATDVGAASIKARRRQRKVPCPPGGVVADYVPFYFAPCSPMMYRIACEHRDGTPDRYPDGDDPLVYLVSSVDRVRVAGLNWMASDGDCAADLTRFSDAMDDLGALVDWPLMRTKTWKNVPEDQDRARRRAAELLVHREFPVRLVIGYAVRTLARKREVQRILRSAGIIDPYVVVRPHWYYGYTPGEVKR